MWNDLNSATHSRSPLHLYTIPFKIIASAQHPHIKYTTLHPSPSMSIFKATLAALAVTAQFNSVLAGPTGREGVMLSIRATDIVKNDFSATEDHPLMALYTRWVNTSPHAELIRRNASSALENFPTLHSIDCYEAKDTCMMTSRMAVSEEAVAIARRGEPVESRGLFWETGKLNTEIHYKTYHWIGDGDDQEYAGFEQNVKWDWKVSYYEPTSSLASLPTCDSDEQKHPDQFSPLVPNVGVQCHRRYSR
jgi:hypothetical protein